MFYRLQFDKMRDFLASLTCTSFMVKCEATTRWNCWLGRQFLLFLQHKEKNKKIGRSIL